MVPEMPEESICTFALVTIEVQASSHHPKLSGAKKQNVFLYILAALWQSAVPARSLFFVGFVWPKRSTGHGGVRSLWPQAVHGERDEVLRVGEPGGSRAVLSCGLLAARC